MYFVLDKRIPKIPRLPHRSRGGLLIGSTEPRYLCDSWVFIPRVTGCEAVCPGTPSVCRSINPETSYVSGHIYVWPGWAHSQCMLTVKEACMWTSRLYETSKQTMPALDDSSYISAIPLHCHKSHTYSLQFFPLFNSDRSCYFSGRVYIGLSVQSTFLPPPYWLIFRCHSLVETSWVHG